MPTVEEVQDWKGQNATGTDGDKLGKIEDIYLDDQTGQPEWASIKTGMFGGKSSFAPLAEARVTEDGIAFPYAKDQVKDSPNVDADGALSQDEEAALYEHYGLQYSDGQSDSGLPADTDHTHTEVGHDTSRPTTDDAMTRSEEELRVGTTEREAGRARLRKHMVTEDVTTTVPVAHEEATIVREPITDANVGDATDGPGISEEEHEVVLSAEEVVVEKRVVPKERVSLGKETVVEDEQVTEQVRKEQIEADGDTPRN